MDNFSELVQIFSNNLSLILLIFFLPMSFYESFKQGDIGLSFMMVVVSSLIFLIEKHYLHALIVFIAGIVINHLLLMLSMHLDYKKEVKIAKEKYLHAMTEYERYKEIIHQYHPSFTIDKFKDTHATKIYKTPMAELTDTEKQTLWEVLITIRKCQRRYNTKTLQSWIQ